MITAWFNEPTLKKSVMQQLREHKRLNEIVQGIYWSGEKAGGRGCHLGCLTHIGATLDGGFPYAAVERLFGIPIKVAHWLEEVFEGLPPSDAAEWVIESTDAIPVGADLSLAHHHLASWLLSPQTEINAITDENCEVVAKFQSLHARAASGRDVADSDWIVAEDLAKLTNEDDCQVSAAIVRVSSEWAASQVIYRSMYSAGTMVASEEEWMMAMTRAIRKIATKSIEIFRSAPITECEPCFELLSNSLSHMASQSNPATAVLDSLATK